MKTEALAALLARSAEPVDRRAVERRFALHLLLAAVLPVAAIWWLVGLRSDLRSAVELPMFWLKLAFPAATALAAWVVVRRLGHPGMRLGAAPLGLVAPTAALWLVAAVVLALAPPADRMRLVLGSSWWQCPLAITVLSVPAFALAFRALSGLAPTRLGLAGAAAGLFAGSVAACAYALACTEIQAPFLAVWYVIGMLIPAGAGALAGWRWLRW